MIARASLALLLLLLCACDRGDRAPTGSLTNEKIAAHVASAHLNRHLSAAVRTLDPLMNQDVPGTTVAQDLFEGLVRQSPDGRIVPGVAERWESSTDGLTWRFYLRTNARWSNGDPVTAGDFVYAWRRVVDPAVAAPMAKELTIISGAADILVGKQMPQTLGVEALDDHTLQVHLNAPVPYFLFLLTTSFVMPVHKATVERAGRGWTQPGVMVSNGPFTLQGLTVSGPIEMVRNPRYWDVASVRLQGVTHYPLTDSSAATSSFLAGDLDATDRFQMEDLGWLRQSIGNQVKIAPYFGTVMMGMHTQRAPFNNVLLRRAMVLAIDRARITDQLFKGLYLPAYTSVPPLPGYPAFRPDWANLDVTARHALAQRLYAQAGYSKEHPLDVEFTFPSGNPEMRLLLEAMAAMWRVNLGANVRLTGEEFRVHQQNRQLHKPDLFWDSWIADYPDPLTFLALPMVDSEQNYMLYKNPQYEAHMKAAMAAADPEVRNAHYNAAERLLDEDAVIVPVYYYQSRHLLRSYVRGWLANPMDNHLSRDVYLQMPGTP